MKPWQVYLILFFLSLIVYKVEKLQEVVHPYFLYTSLGMASVFLAMRSWNLLFGRR